MDERKLVLLHTNDIHSHFERMPRIGEALRQLRSKHAACNPIVIDCGDHMDRMRPETEGSGGLANIAVMNETGYDVIVPGNNEGLTMTPDKLALAYGERQGYSVVCGNLLDAKTGEPPSWMDQSRCATPARSSSSSASVLSIALRLKSSIGRSVMRVYSPLAVVTGTP